MVLVETPFDAHETVAEADEDRARLGWRFGGCRERADLFDGDGELVFELDAVAEAIVDVEVGHLVFTGSGIAVADPAEVNLPMFVTGGFGVVGSKGRSALGVGTGGEHRQEDRKAGTSKQGGRDRHLWELYRHED